MASARASVWATWTIVLLAIAWCTLLVADDRLRVDMRGRYAPEPVTWSVLVHLEPAAEDRWLDVIADGAIYRSIGFALAGVRSFRVKEVQFRELPAGCYDFIAEVRQRDQDGPIVARAVSPWRLTVLGPLVDVMACE